MSIVFSISMYCYYQLLNNVGPLHRCQKCRASPNNRKCKWYFPLNAFEEETFQEKGKRKHLHY